jgi:hypothetical protein
VAELLPMRRFGAVADMSGAPHRTRASPAPRSTLSHLSHAERRMAARRRTEGRDGTASVQKRRGAAVCAATTHAQAPRPSSSSCLGSRRRSSRRRRRAAERMPTWWEKPAVCRAVQALGSARKPGAGRWKARPASRGEWAGGRAERAQPQRRHACGPLLILPPATSAPGLGSPPGTSVPGSGSPLPHLRRDRGRPCHICAGTGVARPDTRRRDDAVRTRSTLQLGAGEAEQLRTAQVGAPRLVSSVRHATLHWMSPVGCLHVQERA